MSDEQPPLLVRGLFRLYRGLLSPVVHAFGDSQCLYLPTCSEYAYVATARFGLLRGGLMAAGRLLRCHPFAKGGLDPVPSAPVSADRLP